jgi:Uma2 family endonuclease
MRNLARPVTAEELMALPSFEGRRELVRGEVREMPPPGGLHGYATGNLHASLHSFVRERGLGFVLTEVGFLIERDPDTVLGPDCAFIRKDRLSLPFPETYLRMAPDLAVETLSPNDRRREVREKVTRWLAAGVKLVWVINPRRQTVAVHRSGAADRFLESREELDGEEVIPGFRIPVAAIFGPDASSA